MNGTEKSIVDGTECKYENGKLVYRKYVDGRYIIGNIEYRKRT